MPSHWFPRHLFPFESRFMEVEGSRIHYVDEGEGPVFLFLHGNPTWSFLYRKIISGLKDRYRCIALDYPGFGLSQAAPGYDFKPSSHARIVREFIERLDLQDVTMMVQDWGGPIGLSIAVDEPGRFRAFVIGNTFAWPVEGDPHFERFSELVGGGLGGFLIRQLNGFVNFLLPAGVKKAKLGHEVMSAYRGPFPTRASREPMHVFPREVLGSTRWLEELAEKLPRLARHPALIVWGERDFAFRDKECARFCAAFPHHDLVVLKGAGHFIQEDAPDEIVTEIRRFEETVSDVRACPRAGTQEEAGKC